LSSNFPYARPVFSLALSLTLAANAPVYALIVANNASNDDQVADLKFADDDGARYLTYFELVAQDARLLSVLDAFMLRGDDRLRLLLALRQQPRRRRERVSPGDRQLLVPERVRHERALRLRRWAIRALRSAHRRRELSSSPPQG
jgi:hypothetical protein